MFKCYTIRPTITLSGQHIWHSRLTNPASGSITVSVTPYSWPSMQRGPYTYPQSIFVGHLFSMPASTSPAHLRRVGATENSDTILKILRQDGGVIIEGLVTGDKVHQINQEMQSAMDDLAEGSRVPDDFVKEFHGYNTKRLTNLVMHSKTFREDLLDNELLHQLCEGVFKEDAGSYWMNSAQVIEVGPGSRAQYLHRDQLQYPIFITAGPNAPEAVINFMVAMTDFTVENGATRVIPGSHKWNDMTYHGTPEESVPAEMKAGDACFMSGKVVHCAGANMTKDFKRRGIAMTFLPSYLTPEEAYPFLVKKEIVETLSKRAQSVLGFRTQFVKDSPGVWKCNYSDSDDTLHSARWEADGH